MVTRTQQVAREAARKFVVSPPGERMTKVDTAWLRMDSPTNLMMIMGVWTLEPGIKYQDLCRRIEERLLKYDRFRQRVQEDATGASWVDTPASTSSAMWYVKSFPVVRRGRKRPRCSNEWASSRCSHWIASTSFPW